MSSKLQPKGDDVKISLLLRDDKLQVRESESVCTIECDVMRPNAYS